MNLSACEKCGASLISEEINMHLCPSEIKSVGWTSYDQGKTWLINSISKDGLSWIQLETPLPKLPTPASERLRKHPDNEQNLSRLFAQRCNFAYRSA
jgi:hypothetical protein